MPLPNSQYDALMRHYSRLQAEDARRASACKNEIYEKIPLVADIDEQIRTLSVSEAVNRISGNQSGRDKYHHKMEELTERKTALLTEAGYPADYMDMHYTCPDCQDTGYIGNERCHCFVHLAQEMRLAQSGLTEILKDENFSTLTDRYYDDTTPVPELGMTVRQHMHRIIAECVQYVEDFKDHPDNLLFTGNCGVGKSFLAHCIAGALLDDGYTVLCYTAGQLSELFSRQIRGHEEMDLNDLFLDLAGCDLLIIDDLGTELGNTFDTSRLFTCINERLLRKKATIITTNLSAEAVSERYSVRFTSRLFSEYKVKPLFGTDIRKEKAKELTKE